MTSIAAGPLQLDVEATRDGPYLAAPHGPVRPLAHVVNAAADDLIVPDFDERLRAGLEADSDGSGVYAKPSDAASDPEAAEAWRRLTGEGPPPDAYVVAARFEPGRLLVPRSVLQSAVEQLRALRDAWRSAAIDLGELEYQARAIDELQLAGDVASMARAAVKRGILLEQLEEAGLLSGTAASERADLDSELHERLLGYARAARRRREYLASAQRASALGAAPSAVSLDWFRLPTPVPPGIDPLTWTAHWEAALDSGPRADEPLGSMLVHDDTGLYRVDWRREDDRPALLSVERVE